MNGNNVIVFQILPERGHLYASFYFAGTLQSRGYKIVYASVKEQEAIITKNGFLFYQIPPDPGMPGGTLITKPVSKLKIGIGLVRTEIKKANQLFLTTDFFSKTVQELNPVALIIDRCFISQTIQAYLLKIPLFTLESTVSTAKFKGIPSLNSYWIPRFNPASNFLTSLIWKRYLFENQIDKWLFGSMDHSVIVAAKRASYPMAKLDFNRFESMGYLDIPELIVSPEEFDFPHAKNINQYYVGPSLFSNRNETGCDPEYDERLTNIKNGPLIYCAMGTMSWRYKGINIFFTALIEAFERMPHWNLILCIDDDISRRKIRTRNISNVHVFKRVPQKQLLERVDLMINHGGMNSITECILSEVPVLVYPGTSTLDQVGNSSRVVYYGLGLRDKLQNASYDRIISQIEELLTTPSYKLNMKKMKEKIMKNKNYDKGAEIVELLISEYYQSKSKSYLKCIG